MKKPAILIMAVTLMMIGVLILEFHLSNNELPQIMPDDYFDLVSTVSHQESKILVIGEDLPFPESIEHVVLSSFHGLSNQMIEDIDYIIIHLSSNQTEFSLTIDEIHTLKLLNHQGVSIIFVGLSSYDFLNIDSNIAFNYPYGVGVIMMNPNSFDQGLYQIYEPNTNNLELRLYNVLRMMVSK